MPAALLALGSNLGDRRRHLEQTVHELRARGVEVKAVSSWHETEPVGGPPNQEKYLNGAALVDTPRSPQELLRLLHEIETHLGRRRLVKDGPRTLDLDLLLYEDRIVIDRDLPLLVPHPRLQDRRFVLEPLVEIAAAWRHPVFGLSMAELLTELQKRESRVGGDLAGMRIMVTGSTSGIGRSIAIEMASAGADVVVHGRRAAAGQAIVEQCRGHGARSELLLADCGDPAAVTDLVARGWNVWQGLDAWIHNAGADTLTGPAARAPFEQKLDLLWNVDVLGTITATRAIGQLMVDRGAGVILTLGWDQAETGMEGDSGQLFAAVKGAVMSYSKSLSVSLAPNVRVNVIAPGWIRTAWGEGASEGWQARVRRETPMGVWGTPEDIASAAHWLVSPAAKFVTGQVIRVNGGAVR